MAFDFPALFASSLPIALQPLVSKSILASLATLVFLAVYININDRAITHIPQQALGFIKKRWTNDDLEGVVNHLQGEGIRSLAEKKRTQTPPKTGRRYIVTGGSGFLGGWLILQLLERGEDPKNIRILDVRPPNRRDFRSGLAKDVPFVKVDITNKEDVVTAFSAPWPTTDGDNSEVTIFHTAAVIRFHERHPSLFPLSEKVNIQGTQNVIDAAKAIGATVLISTSSASVAHWWPGRLFSFPWEWPQIFGWFGLERRIPALKHVLILGDQEAGGPNEQQRGCLPHTIEEFCTIYSYTKLVAEKLVREADKAPTHSKGKILRTGALRPGNAIYGPGSDVYEYFLANGTENVSFSNHIITNSCHVENIALAHLLYEARLIDTKAPSVTDIGGQAFAITDPGPSSTSGDTQSAIAYFVKRFSGGSKAYATKALSPTSITLLAYFVETWYLARHWFGFLPAVPETLRPLQPSTVGLSVIHPLVDDSRARLPVEKGGLGYEGVVDTLEGTARCVKEYLENGSLREGLKPGAFGHGK